MPLACRAALLLLTIPLACSTADGLGTGGGGTGDDGSNKPEPLPDGGECGSEAFGWKTTCSVLGQITYEDPLSPGDYLEIDPFAGPTVACCEGKPSVETADLACVDACVVQLCGMAKNIYDSIARENDWNCVLGCDFDLEGCLAGVPVQQFPHPPGGDHYPHEVAVSCTAANVEPRNPDGTFAFVEIPDNHVLGDPPTCGAPPAMAGLIPLGAMVANTAVDDAGTLASASWRTSMNEGLETSTVVAIAADYELRPCDEGNCLELTRFEASIPAGSHAGFELQSARLDLVGVTARPIVDGNGGFHFPPDALHFVLTASVNGIPLALARTNATTTKGRVQHDADLFELTNLHLQYEDSEIGADLHVDFVGSHANRAPQAAIRRLDTPPSCDDPVVLDAASVDLDANPMRHYWWTPSGMSSAPVIEVVLPPGEHRIILLSVDERDAHDVTSLALTRRCA